MLSGWLPCVNRRLHEASAYVPFDVTSRRFEKLRRSKHACRYTGEMKDAALS
jgi:hypothetical protein